jgi:hypothetical protein
MMKYLIEIAKIITRSKVSKIEIFDERTFRNKESQFSKFYEALQTNKCKTDRDAAAYLYNCAPSDPKYRQLKSRFRKRLLNTLFFLDVNQPAISNYERTYYTANKEWAIVRALSWYGARESAAHLARQLLKVALKFRFADLIVHCARLLRDDCAQRTDVRGFDTYNAYLEQYLPILQAELRAEELYQRILMEYTTGCPAQGGVSTPAVLDCCDALLALSEQHDSALVSFNMYMAWVYRYEMEQDFEGMLKVCERGEERLRQSPISGQDQKMAAFQIKKMAACLHLENYRDGCLNAERSLHQIAEGSSDWFIFMEYYFLLAMHTGHQIHALAIFKKAREQAQFSKLPEDARGKWEMFKTYCDYVIHCEAALQSLQDHSPAAEHSLRDSFKRSPGRQRNFTVLLAALQSLYLLEAKSYHTLSQHIERLKKHADGQLRKPQYYRAVQFIRLLQQLPKANYRKEDLSQVEQHYRKLQQRPFCYRGMAEELEVIPYEKLWGRILAALL